MSAARKTQGENQPSAVLSQDANNKIFSLLGSRAQALSTAVVAVMAAETPKNTEWREVVTGVATLTKDYIRRAFYIQVYDLVGWQRVEEVEVAKGTPYLCSEPLFHQLPVQKRIMGLKFASELDARAFAAAVRAVVGAGPQKPEGPPPPSPKELAAPLQHLQQQQQAPETEHQDSHGAKTDRQQQQQQPQHSQLPQQQEPQQQQQQQPQSPREPPMLFPFPLQPVDKPTTLDRRRASKKITKDMIGFPTNFQHIYHVGFNPEAAPQHLKSEEREQQVTFRAAADSPRRPAPPPPPTRHGAPRTAVEASVATPDTPETVASAEPPVSAGALGSPGVLQSSESPIYNQGDILENPPDSVDTSSPADITSPLREAESPSPPHTSSQELSLVSSDPVEGEFSVLITTKEPTVSSESTENNIYTNHADQDSSTASLEPSLSDSPETSEIQCVSVDYTGPKSSTGSEESNSFSDLQKRNIPADPKEPRNSSYTTPEDSNTSIIPAPSGTSLSNLPAATDLSPLISASTSPQTHSTPSTTSTQSIISSSTRASVESSSTVPSTAEKRPSSSATTTIAGPSPSSTATTIQPASSNTTANSGSAPFTTIATLEPAPFTTTTTPGSVSSTTVTTPELVPFTIATTPAPASSTAITIPERVPSTTTALPEPASFIMIPGPVLSTTTTTTGPAPSPTTTTVGPAPLPTTTTISGLAPSAITATPGPVSFASPTTEPNHFVASSMSSHSFPTSPPTPPAAALLSAAAPDTSPSASSSTTATDPRAPLDTVCGMSPPTPPPPRQRKRPVSRQSPSSAPPPPPPPMSALPSPPPPLP